MTIASHYDGSAPTYSEQYDPDRIYSNEAYPANFFRLKLVQRLLAEAGATSLYEFGAGEATPLARIGASGLRVAGNDVSAEMVRHAQGTLASYGLDPGAVVLLDVQDEEALRAERARVGGFDAVMALGVIPHIEDDRAFVSGMGSFLNPGGTLLLQFRNSMFSLFTFNRLTKEFILDELLAPVPQAFKDAVAADLDQRLAVDKPPIRTRPTGDGYDEILSKFHNPFELADLVRSEGFRDIEFHWYNFHPTYPMIAGQFDPRVYREAQIALEGDTSWRGMFLCSAGLIRATKAS